MFKKQYPSLSFAENFLGGHIRIGPVTVFGENAMHWAVQIESRWGYICFRLPFKCFGRWWPLYFYISPDGTPNAKIDIAFAVLKKFGVMPIRRAKNMCVELFAIREHVIVKDVQNDFGVSPKPNFESDIRAWASEHFDVVLAQNRKTLWLMLEEDARKEGYKV